MPRPSLTPAALVREPSKDFKDDSKAVSSPLGIVALVAVRRCAQHEGGIGETL